MTPVGDAAATAGSRPVRPMLATRGVAVPTGAGWLHEVKWDGMRLIAALRRNPDGSSWLSLTSRLGNEASTAFPELAALAAIVTTPGGPADVVLDGEVVALDKGLPSFPALAERMHVNRPARAAELAARRPVTYLIFDVLRLDGEDLTGRTLADRRALLEGLHLAGPTWQVPPAYPDGTSLFEATREQGLEGVISKRLDSRYEPGVRSPSWLKFPHRDTSSWVVGGWRPLGDTGAGMGALLVGEPSGDGLRYRGRVGSGLGPRLAAVLGEVLGPLETPDCPFVDDVPRADADGVHWVEPLVVVDVEALELLPSGRLRQPILRGVRPDLTPGDLP